MIQVNSFRAFNFETLYASHAKARLAAAQA
jgi:hypothetical protein